MNKKMEVTYKTILSSFHMVPDFKGVIMPDKGSENTGSLPSEILIERGIKRLFVKHDIRFSNSMVEPVFRQLKQKYHIQYGV